MPDLKRHTPETQSLSVAVSGPLGAPCPVAAETLFITTRRSLFLFLWLFSGVFRICTALESDRCLHIFRFGIQHNDALV